jgi:hypothetical protein
VCSLVCVSGRSFVRSFFGLETNQRNKDQKKKVLSKFCVFKTGYSQVFSQFLKHFGRKKPDYNQSTSVDGNMFCFLTCAFSKYIGLIALLSTICYTDNLLYDLNKTNKVGCTQL